MAASRHAVEGTEVDAFPLLELDGVTAGYGRVTVLRDVSLQVPAGSVVALLGANGAGKTTLLRVASGLLRPSAGRVALRASDATNESPAARARQGLCLVPEGRGIFRDLSVRDNLRIQRPSWVTTDHRDEVVEAFPVLGRRLDQLAGSLSGGEQQMLALGRTFMAEPTVVLLDEVSMGLAPIVVDQIFETLVALAARGVSLLLVEQYVERALDLATSVVLLDRGHVSYSGPPSGIDQEALLRNYLGAGLSGGTGHT
jgi:branched-chain amino acid transport system ATP-binding protein